MIGAAGCMQFLARKPKLKVAVGRKTRLTDSAWDNAIRFGLNTEACLHYRSVRCNFDKIIEQRGQ